MTSHSDGVHYLVSVGCTETDYFPHIPIKLNSKIVPVYANSLTRSLDGFLTEDLDKIQLELETLLSKVAHRYRVVQSDYELLDKDEKRVDRRKKHGDKNPFSPGKRKRDEFRKLKTSLLRNAKLKSSPTFSSPQYLAIADTSDTYNFISNQSKEYKVLSKNDTPNKFWLSVEPYCMSITNEDLKVIDELLSRNSGLFVPSIPDFGLHYTKAQSRDKIKQVGCNSQISLLKSDIQMSSKLKGIGVASSAASITGPITNRLVSAMIEEGFGCELLNSCRTNSETNCTHKSFSFMKTGMPIEKKLEKELVAQGLLESAEYSQDGVDEVLEEIKDTISEIASLSEYNGNVLKRLRGTCIHEIARFDLKKNLDIIDHHILETYKNTNFSKRKVLTIEIQQDILNFISKQKELADHWERNNL